jgi:uncharacterized protein YjbJ (UPF0337 family)
VQVDPQAIYGRPEMDFDTELQVDGTWDQVKGKIREEWGDLTDDEVDQARGNFEQFVGTVKQKTGETADAIRDKLESWVS